MEMRGQDEEVVTPTSLGYNRDPSSKISSTPSTATGHGDAIFNSSQTLDHHLYHHHHQHQLINPPQDTHNRPTSPDPVPALIATTTSTDRSTTPTPPPATTTSIIRYRECLKNHAASMGGHVVDGCGEFMPSGEEGTPEALKCAACDCHRNFHRKENDGAPSESTYLANSYYNKKFFLHHHQHQHQHQHHQRLVSPQQQPPAPFYHHNNNNHTRLPLGLSNSTSTPIATAPIVAPLMMAFGGGAAESSSEDLNMFHSNAGGQSSVLHQPKYSKKRFRTKFSQEQKDKMMELAEKIGWRIQKQDEEEVQEFCAQVGVKRQVFKVWMHNNKQLVKKKEM